MKTLKMESREYEDNTRQTTKSSKVSPRRRRHTMKQLAEKNTKITSWVKSTEVKVNIDDQVIDDTDWPELEDPTSIIRKEIAKEKSRKSRIFFMCRNIIEEITERVEARSEANRIVDLVIERSVWRIRIAEVWKLLEDDINLQEVIQKKILRQERDVRETMEAIEKDDRLKSSGGQEKLGR